jgi:parvulin-like peptidyl-prolyl isomerase
MLQQMRSMKMYVFWFVALSFLVGFVFFGGGGLDVANWGQGARSAVAEVNGTDIPADMYNRYVTQLAEVERARFQRDELMAADYERIEAQAWDGIIGEMLVSQEARRLNIVVPDDEIVAILSTNPPEFIRQRFMNEKGEFDQAAYLRAVNDPSYDWSGDENYLRAVLPSMKLQQMVRARATVSEEEVRREYARRKQRTTVRYVGVAWPAVELAGFAPGDAELKRYYDEHPERFMRGETVTLEVLRVDKKPSSIDREEAMEDARGILEDEKRGESFAELAEANSDDPSGERGGDLGWVTPAQLQPAVAEAAGRLAPGQTSPAIEADRGLYIVHVDSVRTGAAGREMRLRQIFLQVRPSGETLDSLRTRVLEVAPEARKDFEGSARKLGATIQKLEPAERAGFIPGVGFSKRLVDWAFTAAPGEVSEPVATEDALLIARLVEKTPEAPRPLAEIRDQVRYALEESLKKERARQRLQPVLAQVQAGAPLQDAARAAGLELQEPAPFTYYESVPGLGSANEFSAVAGALEPGRTSGIVETTNGSYILQVVARDPFDPAAYQQERAAMQQMLLARRENEVYSAWLKDLRERAEIKDHRSPRV